MLTTGPLSNYPLYSKIDPSIRWARIDRVLTGEKFQLGAVEILLILPEAGSSMLSKPLIFICGSQNSQELIRKVLLGRFAVHWGRDAKHSLRMRVTACSAENRMHTFDNGCVHAVFAELNHDGPFAAVCNRRVPAGVSGRFFRFTTADGVDHWQPVGDAGVGIVKILPVLYSVPANSNVEVL